MITDGDNINNGDYNTNTNNNKRKNNGNCLSRITGSLDATRLGKEEKKKAKKKKKKEEEDEQLTMSGDIMTMTMSNDNDYNYEPSGYQQPNQQHPELQADGSYKSTSSLSTWSLLIAALFYGKDKFDINWSNSLLALILIMLMLTTAVGNLFVIVAILIERNLRTIGNYLVLSLAIADLLVALLVMPLAAISQILQRWTLGVLLCDIWTSADVFCCTGRVGFHYNSKQNKS